MNDKRYYIMYNIGKVKYLVNFHDGQKTYKDGSPFYDIKTFTSEVKMKKFRIELKKDGYREEMREGRKICESL